MKNQNQRQFKLSYLLTNYSRNEIGEIKEKLNTLGTNESTFKRIREAKIGKPYNAKGKDLRNIAHVFGVEIDSLFNTPIAELVK